MAEPARALDDVSAQLAEMLRHADALLDDWMRFGAEVRARVEREASGVGAVVAQAVDGASERALALRLAAISTELDRLEHRVRAANRIAAGDRRILAGIAVGIAAVIALLVVLLLRAPPVPPPIVVTQPAPVFAPPLDAAAAPLPPDAAPAPPPDAAPAPAHAKRH